MLTEHSKIHVWLALEGTTLSLVCTQPNITGATKTPSNIGDMKLYSFEPDAVQWNYTLEKKEFAKFG